MYTPGYRTREEAAQFSADVNDLFHGMDLGLVIRAAGDAALYDDVVLTPDAIANKQDGPRSAIYSIVDLRNGIISNAARLTPNTEDKDLIASDRQAIEEAVRNYAAGTEILNRKTFNLAHNITLVVAFPGRRTPLVGSGVELRMAPDESLYATLISPTYLRLAPRAITRYITNMKREGRTDIDPALSDLAYANDRKKVARLLSLSAMWHHLDSYAEQAALEAQFKED